MVKWALGAPRRCILFRTVSSLQVLFTMAARQRSAGSRKPSYWTVHIRALHVRVSFHSCSLLPPFKKKRSSHLTPRANPYVLSSLTLPYHVWKMLRKAMAVVWIPSQQFPKNIKQTWLKTCPFGFLMPQKNHHGVADASILVHAACLSEHQGLWPKHRACNAWVARPSVQKQESTNNWVWAWVISFSTLERFWQKSRMFLFHRGWSKWTRVEVSKLTRIPFFFHHPTGNCNLGWHCGQPATRHHNVSFPPCPTKRRERIEWQIMAIIYFLVRFDYSFK